MSHSSKSITLGVAPIVSAFGEKTIGSKVIDQASFLQFVVAGIETHDTVSDREPGQHKIELPAEAADIVSAGVGKNTNNPDDYVIRAHRGKVNTYLKREMAKRATSVAAIVYTREAYLNDPDVSSSSWFCQAVANGETHVLIAVLASAGPESPLTTQRFVKNLADGNNEALAWTADEIREKAAEVTAYYDEWCVVAD